MTSPSSSVVFGGKSEKVFRRGKCIICGDPFRCSPNGRPRILCRKKRCELARTYQRRRSYEAPGWTEEDATEARRAWAGRCAYCDQLSTGALVVFDAAPLPVCIEHEALGPLAGTTDERCRRAQRWLSRCRPGCPLPNPFAKGTS